MENIRVKFLITYEGTNYSGWQVQNNACSIQSYIEKALSTIVQKPIKIIGAGRTDRGVHAERQVAHADIPKWDLQKLQMSLNGLLPEDIRILSVEEVDKDFHARYSAKKKIYRYSVITDRVLSPFERKHTLHYPHRLDLELIRSLCPQFEGKRDFSGFTHELSRLPKHRSTVKHLYSLEVQENLSPYKKGFSLIFTGEGFLYKMVRNIVGTLLDIGRGKISPSQIEKIFTTKNRSLGGITAPSHGLTLIDIHY